MAPNRISLVDALVLFDRKERGASVRRCLGAASDQLGKDFRDDLEKNLEIAISERARWFLDYHIDWLFSALYLYSSGQHVPSDLVIKDTAVESSITGTQQDFDLVILSGTDLMLVEAKWFGSWDSEQFTKKLDRFRQLEAYVADKNLQIKLHFVLISPNSPDQLQHEVLGPWSEHAKWIELPPPKDRDHALIVFHCRVKRDALGNETARPDRDGKNRCIRRIEMVGLDNRETHDPA